MRIVIPFLLLIAVGCPKDNRIRLFEMFYPNIVFELPAGLSATLPRVYEIPGIATNFEAFLKNSGLNKDLIAGITPYSARISSLDPGLRYDFLREVSIRICATGTKPCTPADEVFYLDRLQRREDDRIDLLPTLRNVKPLLSGQAFKLEVVFFLDVASPYNIESKLDLFFEAIK
jgi:hypothetical protein